MLELQTNLSAGGTGGQGAAPSHFGRSANHIPTRGADYAHHITTRPPSPPGFSDLPTDLIVIHPIEMEKSEMELVHFIKVLVHYGLYFMF